MSGHVAVSPSPQRAATLTARTAGVSTGKAGGGQGLYGTRWAGGAEREGICTERFVSTPHTPSFYKAAFWVFVLFVYAKTTILNKCRL